MAAELWTVILAAGAGRRLASVTGGIPKQFWREADGRSLLEETIDRFSPLAPPSRTVLVVDATHGEHVIGTAAQASVGVTVFQPEDRGTAAGVLLGLTPLVGVGSDAVVAITPSDHGVVDDGRFRRGLLEAARYARSRHTIVLFGVRPAGPCEDYGWITPGPVQSSTSLRPVAAFVEKPSLEQAESLFRSGAVWNTMVVVARAGVVHDLYAELLPDLVEVFNVATRLPAAERDAFLVAAYPRLPRLDFSRDVLTPAHNLFTYIWPASIGWSDLGTPDRLVEWCRRRESSRRPTPSITAA